MSISDQLTSRAFVRLTSLASISIGLASLGGCTLLMEDYPPPQVIDVDPAGEVAGDMAGEVAGDVAGEVAGDMAGEIAGDLAGEIAGDLAGDSSFEQLSELRACEDEQLCGYDLSASASSEDGEPCRESMSPIPEPDIVESAQVLRYSDEEWAELYTSLTLDEELTARNPELSHQLRSRYQWWQELYNSEEAEQSLRELLKSSLQATDISFYRMMPLFQEVAEGEIVQISRGVSLAPCGASASNPNNLAITSDATIRMVENDVQIDASTQLPVFLGTCNDGGMFTNETFITNHPIKISGRFNQGLLIQPETMGIELTGAYVLGNFSIGSFSKLTLRDTNISEVTSLNLSLAWLELHNTLGVQRLGNAAGGVSISVVESVITTDSTIIVGDSSEARDQDHNTIEIRDSTIVMTDPTRPLFELHNTTLTLNNVLIITGGEALRLHNSKLMSTNLHSLSPADVPSPDDTRALIRLESGSSANLDGSYLEHNRPLFHVVRGAQLKCIHLDVYAPLFVRGGLDPEEASTQINIERTRHRGPASIWLRGVGDSEDYARPDLTSLSLTELATLDDVDGGSPDLLYPTERSPDLLVKRSILGSALSSSTPEQSNTDIAPVLFSGGVLAAFEASVIHGVTQLTSELIETDPESTGDEGEGAPTTPILTARQSTFDGPIVLKDAHLIARDTHISEAVRLRGDARAYLRMVAQAESDELPLKIIIHDQAQLALVESTLKTNVSTRSEESALMLVKSELSRDASVGESEPLLRARQGLVRGTLSALQGSGALVRITGDAEVELSHTILEHRADETTLSNGVMIENDATLTLVDVELSAAEQTSVAIYNAARARLRLSRALITGPASYGVYLEESALLQAIESLIDVYGEHAVALYAADSVNLEFIPVEEEVAEGSEPEAPLHTQGEIILKNEGALGETLTLFTCSGAVTHGSCPEPIRDANGEGPELVIPPCIRTPSGI